MSHVVQLNLKDQTMVLSGRIDFDNAATLYQQGLELLKQQSQWPVMVDLSGLEASNTIALAVFVQWVRQCAADQRIVLQHIPAKMQAIIEASNLTSVLVAA